MLVLLELIYLFLEDEKQGKERKREDEKVREINDKTEKRKRE